MLQILLIVCLMFLLSKTNVSKIVFWFLFGCYVMKFINSVTTNATCLKVAHTRFCNYSLIKKYSKTYATYFLSFLIAAAYKSVNIWTPDQCCFNIVDQCWDPTLKMKQDPMSDFQHCTTLIQQRCKTLKRRCTTSFQCCFNVDMALSHYCFKVASVSVKAFWKPIWLINIWICRKVDQFYSTKWKKVLYNLLTIQLLISI